MKIETLVDKIMALPGPVRLVAVDGQGGAGKTTFASRLSKAANNAPVVHTDDFATDDNTVDWWPKLRDEVIRPLRAGESARFEKYDWTAKSLTDWVIIESCPIVIIEGVSAGRREWMNELSYVIWLETPRDTRLDRMLKRDGSDKLSDIERLDSSEVTHFKADPTQSRADLVIQPGDELLVDQHAS